MALSQEQLAADPDVMAAFVGSGTKDREAWLKARRLGIGGSDAPIVCGLRESPTKVQLYRDKVGEETLDDISEMPRVKAGVKLEEVVAQWFTDESGLARKRVNRIVRSRVRPFMMCNLDRLIVGVKGQGLECKTAASDQRHKWGALLTDEIPDEYMVQAQHNIYVAELDLMYVAVLIGGYDFRYYRVLRNERLIAQLIAREQDFWDHVQAKHPPSPISFDDAKRLWHYSIEKPVLATATVAEAAAEMFAQRAIKNAAEKREKELALVVAQHMQEADTLRYKGNAILTWKGHEDTRVDSKLLQAQYPDAYNGSLRTKIVRQMREPSGKG